jgi:hypothetical protein
MDMSCVSLLQRLATAGLFATCLLAQAEPPKEQQAILQRAGIKSRYRILTDLDVTAATTMYEAGQSLASIAKHFGVADRTVLNAFRRGGVPTRAPGTNQWSRPVALPPPQ